MHIRYERRRKVILLYSWLPAKTYDKNMTIWIFFSKHGKLGHCFHGQNYIFQIKIWWNFAKNENIGHFFQSFQFKFKVTQGSWKWGCAMAGKGEW
jgi:hypothetical protein